MSVDHATDIRRTITGSVLICLLVVALILRGGFLLGVLLAVSSLALWEFYSFFWGWAGGIPARIVAILLGCAMLLLGYFQRTQDILICLAGGFLLAAIGFLFCWGIAKNEQAFRGCCIFLAGLLYVPLLLVPVTCAGNILLIFVLGAVAISDTAAYFAGTRLGRHKLCPRISPNKSIEGALGSLVGCLIFCAIYGAVFGNRGLLSFLCLGFLVNIFAQLGDLFESALKRSVNVKDSGFILPGHGGVLDRADSFLFVMPLVAAFDYWFTLF